MGNNLVFHKLICICLLFISVKGQNQNIDSLEHILNEKNISANEQIKICDNLSWNYLSLSFEKSKHYAIAGLKSALKNNDEKMVAIFLRNLGVAYYMQSMHDSALYFIKIAQKIAQKIDDENLIMLTDFAKANIYNVNGEYAKALKLYMSALNIAEKTSNKERERVLFGNIANVFMGLKNYFQAEIYFRKALNIAIEINDISGVGQAYDGLATIVAKKDSIDIAITYEEKAIKSFQQTGEKHFESVAMDGLAMIYYKYKKDYKIAEKIALNALKITTDINMPAYTSGSLNMLSNIYLSQGKYTESAKYAQDAISVDTSDFNIYCNMIANIAMSNIYIEDKEKANRYFDKYTQMINKRANENYQNAISEMQVKYETEKKDEKIYMLLKQKKLYGIITFYIVFSLIILILLFYVKQKNAKTKRLFAEQKIIQLEQEKQIIATQAVFDGEIAERSRLARDLHDSLGGMLSAVKLNLFNIQQNVIIEKEYVLQFNKVIELLDVSISELRRVAHSMMPESLSRFGLKTALTDFCRNISNIQFHYFGEDTRIDTKIEIMIYRTTLELINNALKHSVASEINVQLVQEKDRISLIVQDNGKGFDTTQNTVGIGLSNIKNRVASLNGSINLYSEKNKGTEINIEIKI